MIIATCATISSILATALGGSVINLAGDCPAIRIIRRYSPPIIIEAKGSTVRGLQIVGGGGVVWRGGTLRSSGGENGRGPGSYGALVRNADWVTIERAKFVDSNKALVVDKASNFTVRFSHFEIGGDAVIASRGSNLNFLSNTVVSISMKPTNCSLASGVVVGLSKRDCQAKGGVWTDGWHQDAFQFRDGIKGLTITGNVVRNTQQGIGQMDAVGDAPVSDVLIDRNDVEITGFHSITMNVSSNVRITNNRVRQMTGQRTVIRAAPDALVCGNNVQSAGDRGAEKCH